jgi:hypothetical protein
MQQRRLRLGDILDDYCPRERRITNHAIVAIVDEEVRQTRCTTCDAEHEYKQAKVPPARRKRAEGSLPGDAAEAALRPRHQAPDPDHLQDEPLPTDAEQPEELLTADAQGDADGEHSVDAPPDTAVALDAEPPVAAAGEGQEDEGPVHRRLIRATLPRPEGQAPERKEPEFTIRQPPGRGRGRQGRRAHGPGGGGQPNRFGQDPRHGGGGPRQNQGSGQGHGAGRPHGNRPGGQPGHRGGGNRPGGPGQGHGRGGGGGRKRGR